MAWYDDLWSGLKKGVSEVADVAKSVAPLIPLILKKGGKVSDFKDTPANRAKLVKLFMKMHGHKMHKKSAAKKPAKRGRPAKK